MISGVELGQLCIPLHAQGELVGTPSHLRLGRGPEGWGGTLRPGVTVPGTLLHCHSIVETQVLLKWVCVWKHWLLLPRQRCPEKLAPEGLCVPTGERKGVTHLAQRPYNAG